MGDGGGDIAVSILKGGMIRASPLTFARATSPPGGIMANAAAASGEFGLGVSDGESGAFPDAFEEMTSEITLKPVPTIACDRPVDVLRTMSFVTVW